MGWSNADLHSAPAENASARKSMLAERQAAQGNSASGHLQLPDDRYIIFLMTKPSGIPRHQM
jgi:hypothetical protein